MTRLFNSFWIAGFESASHINKAGTRLDMIGVTGHDVEVDRDYALLHSVGITTAREGVRWHLVDRPGGFEFSSLAPFVTAARDQRIQVIWNLCHYGWPDGLDVFSPVFIDRFAAYAGAVARFLRENGDETPLFAPVNEISFLAWAAGRDIIFPYAHGRDGEIKRQLVRAAIAGCEAIWDVEPRARIVFADPVYHVVAPHAIPELKPLARTQEDAQYEAWDMLAGNTRPELGGHPRYLDVVGLNFYHANQWEYPDMRLRWEDEPRDPRWIRFTCYSSAYTTATAALCSSPKPATSASAARRGCWRWRARCARRSITAYRSRACVCIRFSTVRIGKIPITGTTAACGIW